MANEAYVVEKVAEATKSPKAMLLGAIVAICSTPTNSANTAKELGLSEEEIQRARWVALFKKGRTDLEFLKGLLEIIEKQKEDTVMSDSKENTVLTPKKAREIMGENFFGVGDAIKYLNIDNPPRYNLAALEKIPFTKEVLRNLRNSHILVAVLPLSINEIIERVGKELFRFRFMFVNTDQRYMKACGEPGWELVLKTSVPGSTSKGFSDQLRLIDEEDEKVPTGSLMVYTIIGHYLATGKKLFKRSFFRSSSVRTSSVDDSSEKVIVGDFDSDGLFIGDTFASERSDFGLGIASARKKEGE